MDAVEYHTKAVGKVSEILQSLFKVEGESLVSDAILAANASRLLEPPLTSVLRINTIAEDYSNALAIAQEIIGKQYPQFLVQNSESLPDVIFVPAMGPMDVTPRLRTVVVSPGCAQAVLRGAPVFAAGVLAIADSNKMERHVSVLVDLEGKCTNGLREEYTGKSLFLANGVLEMVIVIQMMILTVES